MVVWAGAAPPTPLSPLTPSPTDLSPLTHTHPASVKLPARAPAQLSPHPPPGGAGAASPGVA